ncbi:MAG TPA: patatin-like phospholipase family protein, partial [Anaeromyxobacteraceae bacterium]|nr:patatin-like phospholipase family protein [Anaeromyxobacteraceae bacterium]
MGAPAGGPRRATLVLSGGGAKGAFQVGAERVLREEGGFGWERVFGVSVGALNGALLGQERPGDLAEVWRTIREEDVHRKFSWPVVAFRVGILGKLGLYDDRPLRATIERHAAGRP